MLATAATAAAVVVLLIIVMAVPLALVIEAERADALTARWRVRWLFGLVDVASRRPGPARAARDSSARPAPRSPKDGRRRTRMGIALLRTRGLTRRARRTALALFRRIRVRELQVRAAFGFDDPADTGIVYGCLSPLMSIAHARGLDVECRPMFVESGLRGVVRATVQVRPLAVMSSLVAFLLSPPALRAMVSVWRARK